MGHSYIT
jgi:hypothetical protein